MKNMPIPQSTLDHILSHFQLPAKEVTDFIDTSHGDNDIRWNILFAPHYVLKIHSQNGMWEERLQEISRLISRYHSIGIYCPAYLPTKNQSFSFSWEHDNQTYTCFVEEYAKYPAYDWETEPDKRMLAEHLGLLASRYTNVDLSKTRSMWSIIDLAPLDLDIDEKQENANALTETLRKSGYEELADQVNALNQKLRNAILPDFRELPRCVFQGDLNGTNILHDQDRFVGLIDFNCSGTDVNINVFLNETNWFPTETEFDEMSVPEMIVSMDDRQIQNCALLYRHYTLNELEKKVSPFYKRIIDLFQYPNVCALSKWLKEETRREKSAQLIRALIEKPL